MIYEKWKANLLFLGTKSFDGIIERIRSQLDFKTFSLAGKTSLEELAVILKKIDLLITVDTGVRHIANATGTNVIVLRNGADSIYELGKYVESEELVVHEVPCSPCGLRKCKYPKMYCMEDISAAHCLREVETLMR
jgi:ADP-heptose:LPS heptosyltransferase